MKNQSMQELTNFKRFVLPVFTEKERAASLELITKGRMRIKTDRILDHANYSEKGHTLNSIAENLFTIYSSTYTPNEFFRMRNIGREWVKHFVIAFSLEEKWINYYNRHSKNGYFLLPKEKQIFAIEEAPDFQI